MVQECGRGSQECAQHFSVLVAPLVLVFSLPSVSFPQLQSRLCLCCQYDLSNGNTQSYTPWEWSLNPREMIMPGLQPHACWVGAPGSCSPLDEMLFLEIVTHFLQKYFHSINTFFLGYQITLCTGNSVLSSLEHQTHTHKSFMKPFCPDLHSVPGASVQFRTEQFSSTLTMSLPP